jgi:hypothetical protein
MVFVLSGFLITTLQLRELDATGSILSERFLACRSLQDLLSHPGRRVSCWITVNAMLIAFVMSRLVVKAEAPVGRCLELAQVRVSDNRVTTAAACAAHSVCSNERSDVICVHR